METRAFASLDVRGWNLTVPEAGNHAILHDSLPASKGGRHLIFDGETTREIIRRGPVLNIVKHRPVKVLPTLPEVQEHEEEPLEEASEQFESPSTSQPPLKLNKHIYFDDDGEVREPPAAAQPSRRTEGEEERQPRSSLAAAQPPMSPEGEEEPLSRPPTPPSPIGPVPRRVSVNKLKRLKAKRMRRERWGSQSPRIIKFSPDTETAEEREVPEVTEAEDIGISEIVATGETPEKPEFIAEKFVDYEPLLLLNTTVVSSAIESKQVLVDDVEIEMDVDDEEMVIKEQAVDVADDQMVEELESSKDADDIIGPSEEEGEASQYIGGPGFSKRFKAAIDENEESDMGGDDDEKDPDFVPEEEQEEDEERTIEEQAHDKNIHKETVARTGRTKERGGAKERERKNRPASRTFKNETKQKRTECPFCGELKTDIPRHIRNCHPDKEITKKPPKQRPGILKVCSMEGCSSKTTRMDMHLQRIHKLTKGTLLYNEMLEEATMYQEPEPEPEPEVQNFAEEAIKDYIHGIQHRKTGRKRTQATAAKHQQALKLFLPVLNKETITKLPEIGADGGMIDQILEKKEYKAPSLKTYLGFLAAFLDFLAGSKKWGRKLELDSNDIQIVKVGIKGVAASLKDDEQKEIVERALLGKDKLDITADMIAGYLHGDRPKEVATLLQKDTFTSATIVNIRDCLALQLILQNFKRSGDIRGLYVNDVLNATVAEGGDFAEIPVYEHKIPTKESTVLVGEELLSACQDYARRVRPKTTSKYMFGTITGRNKGEKMSESLMTKLVHREWQRHQRLHDVELPDITATKARKVATSTSREIGFSKEEQETLALNVMGHRKETSDKYYDKSRKTSKRVAVTTKLRKHYKELATATQAGEGTSAGLVTAQERERNLYRLSIKQSLKEVGLDSELESSSSE